MKTQMLNKINIQKLAILTSLMLFFFTGMSCAQPGKGPQNGGQGMNMGPRTGTGTGTGGGNMGMGALKAAFYPPKLVMMHQNDINLTEEQRENILSLINSNHSAHSRIRWDLQSKMDEMQALVTQDEVDLQQASKKLDEIMALEQQLKKMQLSALIKIKNTLTDAQEKQLDAFKAQRGRGSGPGNRPAMQSPGNNNMRGSGSGNRRNN